MQEYELKSDHQVLTRVFEAFLFNIILKLINLILYIYYIGFMETVSNITYTRDLRLLVYTSILK